MCRSSIALVAALFCLSSAVAMDLALPTPNDGIFRGEPERFYMYVDRHFEGESSTPWEGGTYGFCRTPVRTSEGIVYRRFHEGIDIAPTGRDGGGAPIDVVRSVAAGEVVHVSDDPGHSNYGRYVVVGHDWDGCRYFSLYAHLADTRVTPGDTVEQGTPLGLMGWTGVGIDKRRSHLHLEIGIQLSENFQAWFDDRFGSHNWHGNFNGMNLLGLDVARLLIEARRDPDFTVPQFLARHAQGYWQVLVPADDGELAIVQRYPWLRAPGELPAGGSWRITFSGVGLPLRVEPDGRSVSSPTLVRVRPSAVDHRYVTRGHLTGTGNRAQLTNDGLNFLALVLQE